MNTFFIRVPRFIATVLLCLGSLVSACQQSGLQTGSSPEATQPTLPPSELELGPGNFNLTDPSINLNELSSYTATFTESFEGTANGETQNWTDSYVLQRSNENGTSQLTVSTSDETLFYAEEGQSAYAINGGNNCEANIIDSLGSSIERIDPAGMLSVLMGAEEAGPEEIAGVETYHFTFDERALGKADMEDSSGEIWVAVDGGFVVRYTLTTTGGDTAFGEGVQGTLTQDYSLTQINSTVLPPLPEGCQLNVPVMLDATDILHTGYWLAFNTSANLADVSSYYSEQLPSFGWTLSSGPLTGEQNTFAEYTQGEQTIGVSISAGENGTDVNVVLYSSSE
jgi:hypothetical protein